jgi:hypothetical protein
VWTTSTGSSDRLVKVWGNGWSSPGRELQHHSQTGASLEAGASSLQYNYKICCHESNVFLTELWDKSCANSLVLWDWKKRLCRESGRIPRRYRVLIDIGSRPSRRLRALHWLVRQPAFPEASPGVLRLFLFPLMRTGWMKLFACHLKRKVFIPAPNSPGRVEYGHRSCRIKLG